MADTKKQNLRIIIAALLCIAHILLSVFTTDNLFLLQGLVYITMLVYGFISLCRIILTDQKKTLRFCMPFLIVLLVFLCTKFAPGLFTQFGMKVWVDYGHQT